MILEYKVALIKQRAIDCQTYGASCYAPIEIDDVANELYKDYNKLISEDEFLKDLKDED